MADEPETETASQNLFNPYTRGTSEPEPTVEQDTMETIVPFPRE